MKPLRPFWSYYGAKWRMIKYYPTPRYNSVIESFAGSACYSLHYPDKNIVLCDTDPVIAGLWSYLIEVKESEILSIPVDIECVDDLAKWPQEVRWLVGFWLNRAQSRPSKSASAWMRSRIRPGSFWGTRSRELIASQLYRIRHWRVYYGSYNSLNNTSATWFVDPPYCGRAGSHYKYGSYSIDYSHLANWCYSRAGLVIACESSSASWLPFTPFHGLKTHTIGGRNCQEAVWVSDNGEYPGLC